MFWHKSFHCGIMLIMTLGQVFIMPVKNDNLHECGGCSAFQNLKNTPKYKHVFKKLHVWSPKFATLTILDSNQLINVHI